MIIFNHDDYYDMILKAQASLENFIMKNSEKYDAGIIQKF